MRCDKCNVDLGENYVACPLCGAKATNTEPLIPDQRVAEYPLVTPKKRYPDAFYVFLAVWAAIGAFTFALRTFGSLDDNSFTRVLWAVPCLWTLIGRPIFIRQPYFGNYLAIDILPLSVFTIFLVKALNPDSHSAICVYMPLLFISALLIMVIGVLFKKQSGRRVAPYTVLFAAAGIIGAIVCAVATESTPVVWLIELAFSVLILVVSLACFRSVAAEEIKAKFRV